MNNKEKLSRLIIEAIHMIPIKEALLIEQENEQHPWYVCHPITIGRVMKAFQNSQETISVNDRGEFYSFSENRIICYWQLSKKDGSECTLDDQSDETIKALLKFLTK